MTLRTSLVLSGSDEGASAALKQVDGAMAGAEKEAAALAQAYARADKSAAALARAQTLANVEITSAKTALASGKTNITQYNQALIETKSALSLVQRAHSQAVSEIGKIGPATAVSAGQVRAGTHQIGQQFQDIAVQLKSGTNLGTIIAQQGGQIADAVSMMGGRFAGLATFLRGPWGAAVILGTSVLVDLVAGLFNTGDEAEKGRSGMEKLSSSLDISKASYATLTEVVNEYNKSQSKSTALTYEAIEAAQKSARAKLKDAQATLAQMEAAALQNNPDENLAGAAYLNLNRLRGDVDRLKGEVADSDIAAATDKARRATDDDYAIKTEFDREADKARARRRSGLIDEATLTRQLTALERARLDFTEKWHREHRPQTSEAGQRGREVNLAQATSIASGAGFTVNSGHRTFAEQKWLYDHKRTKENPVAAPGTSAHEKDKALDIAFGPGVTEASITAAYKAQGVRLSKILKETGHFHIEWSTSGADKVENEADRIAAKQKKHAEELDNLGNRSAETISRINEQFDAQPRLIDQAAAATRTLDKTMAGIEDILVNDASLTDQQRESYQQMYRDAIAAKGTIEDALVRPFREMQENSAKQLQIQTLITGGYDDQAEALQRIWQLEKDLRPISAERKQEVFDLVKREHAVNDELRARQDIIAGYLDATRSVKQELVSIFSGNGSVANIGKIAKQLTAQSIVEKLFGNAFKELDTWVKGQSGLKTSVDFLAGETDKAGSAAGRFADAINAATAHILNPGASAGAGSAGSLASDFDAVFGGQKSGSFGDLAQGLHAAQVTLAAAPGSLLALKPGDYFSHLASSMSHSMVEALNQSFNTQFFSKLEGVMSGGIKGYLTAGPAGGILGALQGIPGLPKGIADQLGKALGGAQTGTTVAGIAGAFGIKLNQTGAQLGGALGKFLPFPGGDIVGSIAGGIIGNLVGTKPRGGASVSNTAVGAHANTSAITGNLNETGSNLQGTIAQIAGALGASVGSYSLGIGRYKDYYQVSSNANDPKLGNSYFGRDSKSSLYDGLDATAAMKAALAGAIAQGAIQGISAAMQKALASSKDVQAGIDEALKVHDVELAIGGIGAQIAEQMKSFEKQAAERLRVAKQYGFDVVKIEQKNAADRAKLLKDLLADQVGSLQQLIDEMTSGSLFEGSAVDQRQALLDKIGAAKIEADKGTAGAADTLAQLLTQLNAVSKDAFGTTGGFAEDRSTILDAARSTIALANQRITDAQKASDPALTATNAALDENNAQNSQIIAELGITNAQLQALITAQTGGVASNLRGLALTSSVNSV